MRSERTLRGWEFWMPACAAALLHVNLLAWSFTGFYGLIFGTLSRAVHGLVALLFAVTWLGMLRQFAPGSSRTAHSLLFLPTVVSLTAILLIPRREVIWIGSLASLVVLFVAHRLTEPPSITGED